MEKENNNQNIVPNDKIEGNKNANVPNLRFERYIDKWNKTKLSKILKIKSGKDQKAIACNDGEFKIYGTGGVIGYTNTPIYSKPSVGIGRKGTIDRPFYFDKPFWTVDTLFYSEIFKDDPKFIYYLFQTINWKKYDESTGVPSLSSSTIENINVSIPTSPEQELISNFLTKIDSRIETQNKIIKEYETYKKTISNIILYSNKNTYKTLSDFAILKNGYAFKSETYTDNGIYSIITIGNVTGNRTLNMDKTNKICRLPLDIQSHQILKINDIVVSLTGNVGRTSLVTSPGCLLNQRVGLIDVKEDSNRELIFQCLSTNLFEMKMISIGQGAAQLNIGKQDVEKFPIPINITVKQINLLKNIDLIIQKEKDILNAYKKQKAYLLQNMFI